MPAEFGPAVITGATGLIGVIIGLSVVWLKELTVGRHQRQFAFLQDQTKSLYGPLHFWVSMTMKAFERHAQVQKVSLATPEHDRPSRDDGMRLIELANAYARKAQDNNREIQKTLLANWHLVDPDDVEEFHEFLFHQLRGEMEPFEVWEPLDIPARRALVGDHNLMPPKFLERVNAKWQQKIRQIHEYTHA